MVEEEEDLRALLLRGLAGDEQAHRAFLSGTAARLRAFYRNRMSNSEDAEDLVQETLIAIHTKRDTYDPSYPVTAWIYAIARYRLIDHWRRRKVRGVQLPLEDAPELAAAPEWDGTDARRDVTQLLQKLPEKQRAAIQLVKLDGVSVRDAAQKLGISESDVKVSAHRGLKALMRMMADHED